MMRACFFLVRLTWLAGLVLACGAEDPEDGTLGAKDEPIECGPLTCEAAEICAVYEPSPLSAATETTYECAPPPTDCDPSSLCDCNINEGMWEGVRVTGCSVLDTRTLTISDGMCGTSTCAQGEGCIAFGSAYSGAESISKNYCFPMPEGCTSSFDFCDTDCPLRLAEAAGETHQGCLGSDGLSAVLVRDE